MSAELGKIEKPSVEEFKKGRKLFFIPSVYGGKDLPTDYLKLFEKYWNQVEKHLSDLESKLGQVNRIYHELVPSASQDGIKVLKELNDKSCKIVESRIKKGSKLEAAEDAEILTTFMDWGRCLSIGLQNQKVLETVYESYTTSSESRNKFISKHIDETLEADEIGILFMREGHKLTFPSDIEVFYVSPPAFDELKRWLRNQEVEHLEEDKDKAEKDEEATQ